MRSGTLSIAVVLVLAAQARAEVRYTITDVGTLGGELSYVYGINASGQAVGQAHITGSGAYHAFVYSNGMMKDLGTKNWPESFATAINNRGDILGAERPAGGVGSVWLLFSGDNIVDLGFRAGGINDNGEILGVPLLGTDGDGGRLFIYSGGQVAYLPIAGVNPAGINSKGDVIGGFLAPEGPQAFLYSAGQMINLGVRSHANAINASGEVVGTEIGGAFLYSNGQMKHLNMRVPTALNATGQVVGGTTLTNGLDAAVLYIDGQTIDLDNLIDPLSGWQLQLATGINDSGQIVGFGSNPFGKTRGFILTPIPEPSSLGALVLALLAVLKRRRDC